MLRALRHDHHRRGPRAQPQHRLPARLPQAAAAPPARPEGDHHLGDDRHRSGSPQHFDGAPGHRGVRPHVPGRGALPAGRRTRDDEDGTTPTATRSQAHRSTPSTSCAARGRGDVLVFLSGEREIRDTADALRAHLRPARAPRSLPLYARLSAAEQHRVFAPHTGRRIVLATNVAETSLTVPGIRYVGRPRHGPHLALQPPARRCSGCRSSRSRRHRPNQRAGRCGRAVRRHLHPALRRGRLRRPARVHRAGDPAHQPGLGHPADDRARPRRHRRVPVRRAARPPAGRATASPLLEELGALDPADAATRHERLTPLGRRLARLPVDPRLGRMVLEADRNGCVAEVLVIAAALSIQDPRERPAGPASRPPTRRTAGSPTTARTSWPTCNLWDYLREQQKALSGNAFRRLCRAEFLHYLRVREWQDLLGQLRQVAEVARHQHRPASRAEPEAAIRSRCTPRCCAGLLSHIGLLRPGQARVRRRPRRRFALWPGSALSKKPPRWVMAAELVETSRLWARDLGRGRAGVGRAAGAHLVKRSYSEPHWSSEAAAPRWRYERVTLYGVPLVAGRTVAYGRIDPELSRELFIRHALVEGEWRTPPRVLRTHNRELLERGRGARAPVAAARHPRRRRDARSTSTTSGCRPTSCRRGTSTAGGRRRAATPRTCSTFDAGDAGARRRRRGQPRPTSPTRGTQGDLSAAADLPVRAGRRRRRRHRAHPAAGPQPRPAEGFDWQVPGLRARARRPRWSARCPRRCAAPSCRRRTRAAAALARIGTRRARRAAHRRAGRASSRRPPASTCATTTGTSPGSRTTCG